LPWARTPTSSSSIPITKEKTISAKNAPHARFDYSMFEGIHTKGAPRTVPFPWPRTVIDSGKFVGPPRPGSGQFLRRQTYSGGIASLSSFSAENLRPGGLRKHLTYARSSLSSLSRQRDLFYPRPSCPSATPTRIPYRAGCPDCKSMASSLQRSCCPPSWRVLDTANRVRSTAAYCRRSLFRYD